MRRDQGFKTQERGDSQMLPGDHGDHISLSAPSFTWLLGSSQPDSKVSL